MMGKVLKTKHRMRQIATTSRSVAASRLVATAASTSLCDKTIVLGTKANLEEEKCELVSKYNTAGQRIQRRCNKKKLLV